MLLYTAQVLLYHTQELLNSKMTSSSGNLSGVTLGSPHESRILQDPNI